MPAEERVVEVPEKPAHARREDFGLWAASLVPLLAAGINTIVGFSVAHHACNANGKGALLVMPIVDLLLTIAAGSLAYVLRSRFLHADDVQPVDGRRLFMANMGLLVAGLCTLIILGGLFATILISPCD